MLVGRIPRETRGLPTTKWAEMKAGTARTTEMFQDEGGDNGEDSRRKTVSRSFVARVKVSSYWKLCPIIAIKAHVDQFLPQWPPSLSSNCPGMHLLRYVVRTAELISVMHSTKRILSRAG